MQSDNAKLLGTGAVTAALAASVCCIGPLDSTLR